MSSDEGGVEGELERRSFLRAMALGGAALTSGGVTGCVGSTLQPVPSAPVTPERAQQEAARVSDALAQLDTRLEASGGVYSAQGFGEDDPFSPGALRALTYTGLVLDLPEEVRRSEPLVELGNSLEPELDHTMMDALWVLAHSGDDARERFDRVVRNDPGFVMDFAEQLDLGGAEQGLARGSRLRLRRMATEINSRLRVESADSMLTDLSSKMARVMEGSSRKAARQRLAVTRATLDMFAVPQSATELVPPVPPVPSAPAAPYRRPLSRAELRLLDYPVEFWDRRFHRRRAVSVALVGAGAISLGVGLGVALGGSFVGAPFITIGGVALLLSMVIGGLSVRARRNMRRRLQLESALRP